MFSKNIILLLLLSSFCNGLFCQEKVFELPLKDTSGVTVRSAMVYDSAANGILLTVNTSFAFRRFLISCNDSLRNDHRKIWNSPGDDAVSKPPVMLGFGQYAAVHLIEDGMEELTTDENLSSLFVYKTKYSNNSIVATDTLVVPPTEKIIAAFSQNKVFYVIAAIKKQNKIKIYSRPAESHFSSREKEVTIPPMGKIFSRGLINKAITDFSQLAENVSLVVGDHNYPVSFASSFGKIKLFVGEDKLYFTFTNNVFATFVTEIQLKDCAYTVKKFDPSSFIPGEMYKSETRGNSFIIDSVLITAGLVNDNFVIVLSNLFSGQTIKVLNGFKNMDSIPGFSPVYKVGNFFNSNAVQTIGFGEFISNIYDYGVFGISAYRAAGSVLTLQMGTVYHRLTPGELVLSGLSITGSLAITRALTGMNGILYFEIVSPKNTMYTTAGLNSNQEPDSFSLAMDKSAAVGRFIKKKKLEETPLSVLPVKNHLFLGYFDHPSGNYVLYKF